LIANEVKMKILEKSQETPFFCINLMQNHVLRVIFSVDIVRTCVLCIWNAFIDSLPNLLRIWWKKSFLFLIKK